MARKVNAWMEHLKKFRAANKGMNNKLIFAAAKKTYKKQSGGMEALGSSPFTADPAYPSTGTDLQVVASTYSTGGSKRRGTKRHGTKRHGSKRHGTKRRGGANMFNVGS